MGHTERSRVALAASLVAALLVGTLGFLFPMNSAGAMSPDTGFENCLRDKHNAARKAAGLAPLESRSDLVSFARNHTADMAAAGKIFHSGNMGSATTGWTKIGENVGVGGSCDSLHQAFWNSPGHKSNILGKDYNAIGVGGGVGDDGRMYVTVIFAALKGSSPTPTTAPPAPTTTAPPKPTTTAAPKPTTTTAAPTTTTTAPPMVIPEVVHLDALVSDMIRLALEMCLPVRFAAPQPNPTGLVDTTAES